MKSKLHLSFTICCIIIACGFPAPSVIGQSEKETTNESIGPVRSLEEFEIIGSKEAIFTLPGSGAYLSSDDIGNLQLDDINKILRKIPGVYLREEEGYGLFPNISLRGVNTVRNDKLTVMEDGVLTAPATYSAPSAYYSPTAGRMSGVEVLKGSSQIKYGPHTTGGAINYLSTPIPDQAAGMLKLNYGSDNDFRVHGHTGRKFDTKVGQLGILGEVFHRQTDGFKTIDGAGEFAGSDDTGFKRTDYTFKASWEPNTERYNYFEVKLSYMDLHADNGYLGLSTEDFEKTPYRLYAASRNDRIDTNHTNIHLRHIIKLNPDMKLTTTVYYNKFHRNWFKLNDIRDIDVDGNGIPQAREDIPGASRVGASLSAALAGSNDGLALEVLKGQRAGDLRVRANNRDYYMAGVQTAFNYSFMTGDASHELETGIRFHKDRIRRFQWHDLFQQDSQGNFSEPIRSALGSDGNRRQATEATAFYLEDKINIGRWSFQPGVRFENLDFSYTDFTTDGSNLPTENGTGNLQLMAPGISSTYQYSDKLFFFAGYHRGVGSPGPRASVRNGVVEENSDAVEAGVRYDNHRGLYGEAVFFHTSFDDLIVADNIGGAGAGETENVGQVTSNGLELLVGFDPGSAQDWGFRNPNSIAFTYTDATLDGDSNSQDAESVFAGGKDGNQVPYIPEFQVTFSTGLEFEKFSAYLNATYVDGTFSTAANSADEINPNTNQPDARFGKTDSHLTVDLSANYELRSGLEIFGAITNLFDTVYIASRHPHGPRPGAPRLATFGMKYSF